MTTRRHKTGGRYVGSSGLGSPVPDQWQYAYETQTRSGAYVAVPGSAVPQYQYLYSNPVLLDYASADPSVFFYDPLTSDPTTRLAAKGITVTAIGTPTYSATLGVRGYGAGADAGLRLLTNFSAAQLSALNTAGQLSYEIEPAAIAARSTNASVSGSTGAAYAGTATAIHVRKTSTSTGEAKLGFKYASDVFAAQWNGATLFGDSLLGWAADAGPSNLYLTTAGKSSTVRVVYFWFTHSSLGMILGMAVDGVVLAYGTLTVPSGIWENIGIGGVLGGGPFGTAISGGFNGHYIRNIQLSAKPVAEPTDSGLGQMAIMSDSIISAGAFYASGYRENCIDVRMHRALESRGKKLTLYRMQAGGHLMTELSDGATTYSFTAGSTASQVVSSGLTNADVRGKVLTFSPKTIIINGGSNDVGTGAVTLTKFTDAIKDHICYFLGLDSTGWVSTGGTNYSGRVDSGGGTPSRLATRIFLTNIPDRGFSWEDAAVCTGNTNGTTTISGLSATQFQNGDSIGGYVDSTHYIPEGATVVSGGGTSTIVISAAAVGTSTGMSLYKPLVQNASSAARVKAATFRAAIDAIPASFCSQFPGNPCTIQVIDVFTAMGGTTPSSGRIQADGVHPSYLGVKYIGDAIGAAIAPYA